MAPDGSENEGSPRDTEDNHDDPERDYEGPSDGESPSHRHLLYDTVSALLSAMVNVVSSVKQRRARYSTWRPRWQTKPEACRTF